jgi:hypothetical protein
MADLHYIKHEATSTSPEHISILTIGDKLRLCCCPCWTVSDLGAEGGGGTSWCETEEGEGSSKDNIEIGDCVFSNRLPGTDDFIEKARDILNAAFSVSVTGVDEGACPDWMQEEDDYTEEDCCQCINDAWDAGEGPAEQVTCEPISLDSNGVPKEYKVQFKYDVCLENGGKWRATHGYAVYFAWKYP